MVDFRTLTIADVMRLLREGLASHPEVRFAFLFGSVITRGLERARDIDLAVSFRGAPELMALGNLAAELDQIVGREVDVVDLDPASTLLRWEVVRTGQVVTAPDRDALLAFQARVPIEYADLRPYFEREIAGLRDALARGS
jgi:uncharacterized protein